MVRAKVPGRAVKMRGGATGLCVVLLARLPLNFPASGGVSMVAHVYLLELNPAERDMWQYVVFPTQFEVYLDSSVARGVTHANARD